MSFLALFPAYLLWHLTTAWGDLWRLYTNTLWFLHNLFSIKLLLTTLFSPWRRLHEAKELHGAGGVLGRIIINTITRLFGLIVRTAVIVFGLLSLVIFSLLSACLFALWIVLPLVAVGCALYGFTELVGAFATV